MRVAVVFPTGHLFDTPCVPNLVKHLARNDVRVDFYVAENIETPSGILEGEGIRKYIFPIVNKRDREHVALLSAGFLFWLFYKLFRKDYDTVIACGVRGLFVVGLLAPVMRLRFAYNSLELYSGPRFNHGFGSLFKKMERLINRNADFSIIQDEIRAELLTDINTLEDKPIALFPNAPYQNDESSSADERLMARYGVPEGARLVLCSGSLTAPWAGIHKILNVAKYFPPEYVLFLQSRSTINREIMDELQFLIAEGRVVISGDPMSVDDYDRLVQSSSIGLAWYESEEKNIRHVGLSSGKIAHYLRWGKPFIVNSQPLYDEITDRFRCGVTVSETDDIGAALETISRDYDSYSQGARKAYSELFDMDKYAGEVIKMIRESARYDGS